MRADVLTMRYQSAPSPDYGQHTVSTSFSEAVAGPAALTFVHPSLATVPVHLNAAMSCLSTLVQAPAGIVCSVPEHVDEVVQ